MDIVGMVWIIKSFQRYNNNYNTIIQFQTTILWSCDNTWKSILNQNTLNITNILVYVFRVPKKSVHHLLTLQIIKLLTNQILFAIIIWINYDVNYLAFCWKTSKNSCAAVIFQSLTKLFRLLSKLKHLQISPWLIYFNHFEPFIIYANTKFSHLIVEREIFCWNEIFIIKSIYKYINCHKVYQMHMKLNTYFFSVYIINFRASVEIWLIKRCNGSSS